ncbi:hypothetical protein ACYX34_12600, partial [Nitrospira sp. CMX1]
GRVTPRLQWRHRDGVAPSSPALTVYLVLSSSLRNVGIHMYSTEKGDAPFPSPARALPHHVGYALS